MSDQETPDPAYSTTVEHAGVTITIRPVSYKQARAFRAAVAALADRIASPGGVLAAGLDDQFFDLMELCCTPRLDEIEDLPLSVAGRCFAAWVELNIGGGRWSPTVDLLERTISSLAGRSVSLKTILSRLASPPVSRVPTSSGADDPAGDTAAGPTPSFPIVSRPPRPSMTADGQIS